MRAYRAGLMVLVGIVATSVVAKSSHRPIGRCGVEAKITPPRLPKGIAISDGPDHPKGSLTPPNESDLLVRHQLLGEVKVTSHSCTRRDGTPATSLNECSASIVASVWEGRESDVHPNTVIVGWRLPMVSDLGRDHLNPHALDAPKLVGIEVGAQLPFGSGIGARYQLISGFSQSDGENSQDNRENGDNTAAMVVKKFADLDTEDQRHAVTGTIFLIGLGCIVAWAIGAAIRKKW